MESRVKYQGMEIKYLGNACGGIWKVRWTNEDVWGKCDVLMEA